MGDVAMELHRACPAFVGVTKKPAAQAFRARLPHMCMSLPFSRSVLPDTHRTVPVWRIGWPVEAI
jgi:hypothetical protein